MGPDRAKALSLVALLVQPVAAQTPGWHYSPLPGEGDRASLGCMRGATEAEFTCLAVRCEDDFSTGIHVYTSRFGGAAGKWIMTLDREARTIEAVADGSPYSGRVLDDGWLLDRLREGTFAYLRHEDDQNAPDVFLDLSGSYRSIAEALAWCAPRVPPAEQNAASGVDDPDTQGEKQ